ncbi:MAG TPA: hypothetical protein PLI95_05260 [Polyangiaceae bacterium]|nr:hypothetical protein [Polyangiaceae bacterium]
MASPRVLEIKKHLVAKGILVYRSGTEDVLLAERVRDNLIMDASVAVIAGEPLRVRFLARAQRNDFPWSQENPAALFERARRKVAEAAANGFREVGTMTTPLLDPVDAEQVLDVWYQVAFEKDVTDLDDAVSTAKYALELDKVALR